MPELGVLSSTPMLGETSLVKFLSKLFEGITYYNVMYLMISLNTNEENPKESIITITPIEGYIFPNKEEILSSNVFEVRKEIIEVSKSINVVDSLYWRELTSISTEPSKGDIKMIPILLKFFTGVTEANVFNLMVSINNKDGGGDSVITITPANGYTFVGNLETLSSNVFEVKKEIIDITILERDLIILESDVDLFSTTPSAGTVEMVVALSKFFTGVTEANVVNLMVSINNKDAGSTNSMITITPMDGFVFTGNLNTLSSTTFTVNAELAITKNSEANNLELLTTELDLFSTTPSAGTVEMVSTLSKFFTGVTEANVVNLMVSINNKDAGSTNSMITITPIDGFVFTGNLNTLSSNEFKVNAELPILLNKIRY